MSNDNFFLSASKEELKKTLAYNIEGILVSNIHVDVFDRSPRLRVKQDEVFNNLHLIDRLGSALNAAMVLGGYTWDAKRLNDEIELNSNILRKHRLLKDSI